MDQKKSRWKGNVKSLPVIINDTAVKLTTYTLKIVSINNGTKSSIKSKLNFQHCKYFLKFNFLSNGNIIIIAEPLDFFCYVS